MSILLVGMAMLATENRGSGQQRGGGESRPPVLLGTEKMIFERKVFFIDLKENQRGRMYKITEDVAGRRDTIMLPAEGAREFIEALTRLVEFEESLNGGGPA